MFLLLLLAAIPAAAADVVVYDDQLRSGFQDWSWATRNLSQTAVVHSGTAAISFEPDGWSALFLHTDAGIDPAAHDAVEFWIRGSATGLQLRFAATEGGDPVASAVIDTFVEGGAVPNGTWAKVRVEFADLGVTGPFDGFWIQDDTGGNQAATYVDAIVLKENLTPPPPPPVITVAVDPSLDRRTINREIYGVNFGNDTMTAMKWPVNRWGGNSKTRYNWELDIHNTASDWFFMNIPNGDGSNLPAASTANAHIDITRANGGQPLVTVPMIGWVPLDVREKRWGYDTTKYNASLGPQDETECSRTNNADWCMPTAGDGESQGNPAVIDDGAPLTGVDPTDTSKAVDQTYVTSWMAHIASRTGNAGAGGVKYFALDNEVMLWNSTHRDVHPAPLGMDELWTRTAAYAGAMKAADPNVKIFGPVTWGWCDLFYSAADGCGPGADRAAHGNMDLVPWYLQKLAQHQQNTGVRLVDYLDIHYYPQGTNVALDDPMDESAATSARRLRSLKELYDPTWDPESWVGDTTDYVALIPRVKSWIDTYYPGTKLAITEYHWGNDAGLSSALAQAEVLAIFGREGVDLATRWVAPAAGSLVESAFKLYLNYDGAGSDVEGESVRATSSNRDAVGSYAVRESATRTYLLLFNKDTVERNVVASLPAGTLVNTAAPLFRLNSTGLNAAGMGVPAGDTLTLSLPARTATLAVLTTTAPPESTRGFYTIPPCRLLDTRNPAGAYGGPVLSSGNTRSVTVTGQCGVPAGAIAIAANVTAVTPTGQGHVTVWPAGATLPLVSTINFSAGQVRANNAVVALSGSGGISLRPAIAGNGQVHFIVDVTGYFLE